VEAKGDQSGMSKVKTLVMTFIAVLALGAVASTSASAATPGWMVSGTTLSGSEALATTAAVDENAQLTASGVTIECTGKNLNGLSPKIEAGSMGSVTSLIFTGCKALGTTCTIESTEIGTVPVLAEATLEGSLGVKVVFSPQSGTIFATIKYLGASCALLGLKPVTGKASVSAPTGQDEQVLQQIVANTASGELQVGSASATLKGKALLKLATSSPWSYL